MSLNFTTDTSTQLTYSSFGFTTPPLDNYATSNFVSNVSNVLRTAINTKQDTLTAATSLLGNGSAITNISYGNITGKPTNFQADWLSTIINKPSTFPADMSTIYNKTEIDNITSNNSNYTRITSNVLRGLINNKQDTLTAATTLLGIGSNITLINYSNLSNIPSTFPPNMSNIYSRTESDNITSNLYSNDFYERQYPPKVYDSVSGETTATGELTNILPTTFYKQTITLNTSGITYGSGTYIIYSSTTYGSLEKQLFFNFNFNDPAGAAYALSQYSVPQGTYLGSNYIVSGYTGDWIVIKLPVSIILTKFVFKDRPALTSRAPGEWKCYGSNDGITFTEITEASQLTRLTASDYSGGTYTKRLNMSFQTKYLYIGFTFNKNVGGANSDMINFNEIQLFGKEQLILPFYTSLNVFNSTLTNYSTTGNDTNYLLKIGGTMTGAINGATRIGIGITNPDNILQVGDGGRLRISNSNIDFTILGTKDNFGDTTNTRIVLSGSARSTQAGNIEYVGVNNHIFYTTSSGAYDERMRILSTGRIGISTSSPLTRFTIRSSYSDENTGFSIDATDGSVYNLRLFPYVIAGARVGYIFKVNNQASSTNTLLLGDNGSVGVGVLDTAFKLNVNGNIKTTDLTLYNSTTSTYQLLISGPSSTGPANIQTIQQGVGYNQNIVFQNSGGNVGIGTLTNITEKLFVNGNIKATNLIASTRITAEGDVRSPNFTAYNSANTNYEITMTAPSSTGPANIQTVQQGANFNQSLTIQAAGNGTVSIGTTSVGTYKLNVNGSLNATTLWQNGTQIDFNSYATNTNITNTSNYSLNISNVLKTNIDANNTATNTAIGNTSNYSLNISNVLKTNIDANNTATNTAIGNTSNYSLNISNVLKTNIDANNTATNTAIGNSSNYALNISNILTARDATNLSSSSNYSLNISNVLWTNVNTNFLKLSGGSMTGQITGVTTLNGTTGIFGTLSTTNNTNVALPSVGVAGGIGDKLILYAGTASVHPFSLGINNSTLWYSVPTGAHHIFYTAGTERMRIKSDGNVGIGTTDPTSHLQVNGRVNINNGSPYATANNFMQSGSLTIGGTNANYGGGNNWTGNTAGLMMECDVNTEIAIHDAGQRIASFMYYANNVFTIGRDMGWNPISLVDIKSGLTISGQLTNQFWRLTNQSDWLRVYTASGDNYFNFAANYLFAAQGLTTNNECYFNISGFGTIMQITSSGVRIPGSTFSIAEWYLSQSTSPTNVLKSFVFHHSATGVNSKWWFNGAQTNTSSEISDERIKKEINDIQTPLNKIMALKPKEYYLCDDKDYNKKFGIIAQDVEKVFPELIHTEKDYIANIYSYAKYDNGIITLDKDITDLINIDDELKIILDNNDKNNLEIIIDDTPYNNRYKRRFVKVVEIIDNHSFKIDIDLEIVFTSASANDIFIYGKKVDDFKRLDYESLYCLNIAATQELFKIIQSQQKQIEELKKIFIINRDI